MFVKKHNEKYMKSTVCINECYYNVFVECKCGPWKKQSHGIRKGGPEKKRCKLVPILKMSHQQEISMKLPTFAYLCAFVQKHVSDIFYHF